MCITDMLFMIVEKGSGQAGSLSSGSTNIILEAKLAARHKKMNAQIAGTPGTAAKDKAPEGKCTSWSANSIFVTI